MAGLQPDFTRRFHVSLHGTDGYVRIKVNIKGERDLEEPEMQGKSFLIVAASIGAGHVKAAEAVADELKIKYPEAAIRIVDFTMWRVSWATAFMKAAYLAILHFVPNLYEFLYKFTGGRAGGISVQSLISVITQYDIAALIKKYRPDAIICTHPFPAGATSWLKKKHPDDFLFATVITDYSVHQMWIYPNVDRYFVAREAMKTDLIAAGLTPQHICVTGIPVTGSFHRAEDRPGILRALGLTDTQPVVLIMGGGLGLGGVDFALMQLEKMTMPLQILVVAGRNAELKARVEAIAARSQHKVEAWGYSTRVRELMAAATLLISKPGALTISEALAAELPMLLHEPIPGPETENAVYAARRGTAIWLKSDEKLGEAIADVLTHPERLDEMRENARQVKRPFAAREIVACLSESLKIFEKRH